MEKQNAISLWKENGISRGEMDFSCGGDSMNDWSFKYFDTNDEEIYCNELDSFFDDDVFRHVDFYVNSDGHYMGEMGTVHIELEEEDEDFTYVKCAESEWNETITNTLEIKLTDEQINYLKEFVSGFVGGSDEDTGFNYSKDFIMTDEHERIEKEIGEIIYDVTSDYEPETDNEVGEWFNYVNETPMFNEDNLLLVELNNETIRFTNSED